MSTRGSHQNSPLEEAGFEPLVPSERGTGRAASLFDSVRLLSIARVQLGGRGATRRTRWDRQFESPSLQHGVCCEPNFFVNIRRFGPVQTGAAAGAGFDDRQAQVYRAPSQAGPGNDINAGSLGFQKAPTRGPASLVAFGSSRPVPGDAGLEGRHFDGGPSQPPHALTDIWANAVSW